MTRLLGTLFCVLFYVSVHSQAPAKLDSLLNALKTTPKNQAKIDLYEKICWYHIDATGDLVQAKKFADSVKMLSEEIKSEKGSFQAEYNYGMLAHFQGTYLKALEHLQRFTAYFKTQGDSVQVAKGLYHIAMVNMNQGNYDKTLAILYRVLAIEEKVNNSKKIASVLNVIGATYKKANKFQEALTAYRQANKIFQAANLKVDYAMGLTNMANIFITLKNYDSAKLGYEESLEIFYNFKNPVLIGMTLGNLGNLYEAKDEYNKALQYHQQALAIWRTNTRKSSLANSLNNNGKSFLKLKKYNEAEVYLKEALTVAQEIKANPLLVDIYSNMNALHLEKREFEKAYHFYALSSQIKDSLFNETNTKQLNELQTKYESEKKDKQITLLAKEKELQAKETERQTTLNKAFAIGLALMILVAGLLFYIFRQRLLLTTKNTEVKEADFKRQVSELEMKALRAQINPHFLFNCMNAINLMIRKGETENACLYLAKFSKLVRLILENAEASAVTLESEIALMESYIQLEELRFPRKISYTISVDESIGIQHTYLPSMVLQPVIENAIWHGIVHKDNDEKGVITVDVRQEEDRLLCTIEDNGVGRDRAKELRDKSVLNNKSMGMKITEERLRLLSRKQREHFIEITDLRDTLNHAVGTRVTIHIPISEQ
jgi:tetratricopeptide (TPR) repeat protein/two-component sensor histidine kinase